MSDLSDQASQSIGEYLNLSGTINVSEHIEEFKYYVVLSEVISMNHLRFDEFCKLFDIRYKDKTETYFCFRIDEESLKKFLIWYKLS